ncbi:MAG: addiction module protein [Smithella sp.]
MEKQQKGAEEMGMSLSVEKMSIEEKFQTMETIWDDLCKKADSISSPPWHEKVLNDREENGINNGEDVFIDLNTAKKTIEKFIA